MTFDVDRSAFSAERDTAARGINMVCIHFMTSYWLGSNSEREEERGMCGSSTNHTKHVSMIV